MRSQLTVTAAALTVALTLAACSGSSGGTHAQSLSPAPTDSSTTSSSAPVTSTSSSPPPSPSPSDTSSSSTARSSGVPTPSVAPSAQRAVNAYVANFYAASKALRDPAHADLSWIAKYETGTFRTQEQQSFASLKSGHLAYRGAVPNPNIKVQSVLSPTAVILTSCLVVHPSDPWVRYNTTTGKAASTAKPRTPPPPHLLQLFMKSTGGVWQVSSVVQDTSKTCKG